MAATLGADDIDFLEFPNADLLKEITGIDPQPAGAHVLLDQDIGVRSTQRFALAEVGGSVEVALWPGEMKSQAQYLYRDGRGSAMVEAARDCGWKIIPSPHLAFFNSRPSQRLYMAPELDAETYAARWEGTDGEQIGRHPRDHIRDSIWPWLKERNYASDEDDGVFESFLTLLGRRPADLRPGMRFRQRYGAPGAADRHAFAKTVRRDVNTILAAASEPTLAGSP